MSDAMQRLLSHRIIPLGKFGSLCFVFARGCSLDVLHPGQIADWIRDLLWDRVETLEATWPRADGRPGWDRQAASDDVMAACAEAGIIEPRALGFVCNPTVRGTYSIRECVPVRQR